VELSRGIACLEHALAQDGTIASPELAEVDNPLSELRRRHTHERPSASGGQVHSTTLALLDSVDDDRRGTWPLETRAAAPVRCTAVERSNSWQCMTIEPIFIRATFAFSPWGFVHIASGLTTCQAPSNEWAVFAGTANSFKTEHCPST